MDDWDDYGYDDYYSGSDDDVVVMDPFNVNPGDDSDYDDLEENPGIDESNLYGSDFDNDGNADFAADMSSDAILGALNTYGSPGWQQESANKFRNPSTGQTYDSSTGKISTPKTNSGASSTNPRSTASGGSSGSGGSFGSGGGSSSGSSGSSAVDNVLKTLTSLLSNFGKVSNAVSGTNQTAKPLSPASLQAPQFNGTHIAIGVAAVAGLVLLLKKSK